jgi:hypothetical protein
MAASPVCVTAAHVSSTLRSRRPPLALTTRRLEANRRNAARSTGPRTAAGNAHVARKAIKHGFFVGAQRRTEQQRRDFAEIFDGLSEDFKPQGDAEEICVATIADSYVRMASLLRYENIAALEYHQQCERELNERIATADESQAARLRAHRETLRRAGLWRPTIPGPREGAAIRYQGRLDRPIRGAMADLRGLKSIRDAATSNRKLQKRRETASSAVLSRCGEGPQTPSTRSVKAQKQTHFVQQNSGISAYADSVRARHKEPGDASSRKIRSGVAITAPEAMCATNESAETKPLSSTFTGNFAGNRHELRRARAQAR